MKTKSKIILGTVVGVVLACLALNLALALSGGHLSIKLPLKHGEQYQNANMARFPQPLSVRGNQIVDPGGTVIRLAGVMPRDPDSLQQEGKLNSTFFAGMHQLGANVVRIPVFPENWTRDADFLWRYLDPIVSWAGENGMYVIIDWHYIGNIATGAGPKMPDLDAKPKELTLEFWRQTAGYFRATPNVIFEIFNEPQAIEADVWQKEASEVVQAIRDQGASQLVIVGGIDYGKDLSWVLKTPVQDANLAYASHIYPSHPQSAWPVYFGLAAEKYPVLITEWGFLSQRVDADSAYLVGDVASYGEPLLQYLDQQQIGWVACWYDNEWLPPIFQKDGSNTPYGEWMIGRLKK